MSTSATTLSRPDRWAMYATAVLGAGGAAATAWWVVARLVEMFSGDGMPVLVPSVGGTAPLPIGPDGAPVEVEIGQATVMVTDPAPATLFAIVAHPIAVGATTLVGIVLLCLLCINLARGRAFHGSTVRIVLAGAVVLAAGWLLGSLFRTMAANGAFAAVSDGGYDGAVFEVDVAGIFGVLALGAIAAAFQIGNRLQRETEGLV